MGRVGRMVSLLTSSSIVPLLLLSALVPSLPEAMLLLLLLPCTVFFRVGMKEFPSHFLTQVSSGWQRVPGGGDPRLLCPAECQGLCLAAADPEGCDRRGPIRPGAVRRGAGGPSQGPAAGLPHDCGAVREPRRQQHADDQGVGAVPSGWAAGKSGLFQDDIFFLLS